MCDVTKVPAHVCDVTKNLVPMYDVNKLCFGIYSVISNSALPQQRPTFHRVFAKDGKFSIQIGSDWPQMGQIWEFLRLVSVHFGSLSQNVLKLVLKSPTFVQFESNLSQFGCQI